MNGCVIVWLMDGLIDRLTDWVFKFVQSSNVTFMDGESSRRKPSSVGRYLENLFTDSGILTLIGQYQRNPCVKTRGKIYLFTYIFDVLRLI